ncbi:MAG TPA: dTDP-4-dehydrorhamnose reductase [Pseudomonadales bacterium]|nr:dTDP-4-dehydrorhamnose reductase [Pseudomonadales bacterium]
MKILLFGKNGQIGWELQRSLASIGEVIAVGSDSKSLCGNLKDLDGIAETVRYVSPSIIVNAAAHTAVDKAESEPDLARTMNALAPAVLAREAKQIGAWLIHYSTDYVFDGSGDTPWLETDTTNPLNIYGQTKLEGEEEIRKSGCLHLIFRTSWVHSTYEGNFVKTILDLGQKLDQLSVVSDQVGAPTGADLLADISAHAIRVALKQSNVSGLYNLVASGQASRYDYAIFILEFARKHGVDLKVAIAAVRPIATHSLPASAQRPKNSRLNASKLQNTFEVNLPQWQDGVERTLIEILER